METGYLQVGLYFWIDSNWMLFGAWNSKAKKMCWGTKEYKEHLSVSP